MSETNSPYVTENKTTTSGSKTIVGFPEETVELGTTNLGGTKLGITENILDFSTVSLQTEAKELSVTNKSVAALEPESLTTSVSNVSLSKPISLSPENLFVTFNRGENEFQSEWFVKETPLDKAGEVVVVAQFRDESFNSVDFIVERDDTGDGTADARSEVQTLDSSDDVIQIESTVNGKEIAEIGGKYRVRFPDYEQTDAISRFTMALGWDSDEQFNEEWDISPVSTESQPAKALIAVLLSENYRFDATLDEIFESQHISKSSHKSLDLLSKETGIVRKQDENDPHLRKRAIVKSATRTFSSVGSDVTDLIGLLFDDESDKVEISAANNTPELRINVPVDVMENNILNSAEIEDALEDAIPSSYGISVNVIGSEVDSPFVTEQTTETTLTRLIS